MGGYSFKIRKTCLDQEANSLYSLESNEERTLPIHASIPLSLNITNTTKIPDPDGVGEIWVATISWEPGEIIAHNDCLFQKWLIQLQIVSTISSFEDEDEEEGGSSGGGGSWVEID